MFQWFKRFGKQVTKANISERLTMSELKQLLCAQYERIHNDTFSDDEDFDYFLTLTRGDEQQAFFMTVHALLCNAEVLIKTNEFSSEFRAIFPENMQKIDYQLVDNDTAQWIKERVSAVEQYISDQAEAHRVFIYDRTPENNPTINDALMNAKVKPAFDFTENPIVQPHQPYFRDSLTLNVFSEFCAKHLAILLTGMHPPKDDPYYEQARMVNAFQSLFLGGMQIVCDYLGRRSVTPSVAKAALSTYQQMDMAVINPTMQETWNGVARLLFRDANYSNTNTNRTIFRGGQSIPADVVFDAWTSGDLGRMLAVMDTPTHPIDRHHLLSEIVTKSYARRKDNASMCELMLKTAQTHLDEFPSLLTALQKEFDPLPQVPTFQLYATALSEMGEFKRAIQVCEQALKYGLRDGTQSGFKGRIERILKKQKKEKHE